MITSASSGTTSQTICSMISRDRRAMAAYSGPRAPMAAIFSSTAAPTAALTTDDTAGDSAIASGRGVVATGGMPGAAGAGENSGDGVPPDVDVGGNSGDGVSNPDPGAP